MTLFFQKNQYDKRQNSYSPTFTARKVDIRKADDICRRVMQEFPTVSNTKLEFHNKVRSSKKDNYQSYVSSIIHEFRTQMHNLKFADDRMNYLLTGLKENHFGNCSEMANATSLAFNLNGYENVRILSVCAYNKKTKNLRELDHDVVGINFSKPKNIPKKYPNEKKIYDVVIPNKNSIIVDSWAGFTDSYSGAVEKYKHNSFLDQINKNETICFIPSSTLLVNSEVPYYKKIFPNLILKENKNKVKNKNEEKSFAQTIPLSSFKAYYRNFFHIHKNPSYGILQPSDSPPLTLVEKFKKWISRK
jgi:hypothetical protein